MMLRKRRGYSLMEIALVLVIIGILMTFMVPRIKNIFKKITNMQVTKKLRELNTSVSEYLLEVGRPPASWDDLVHRPEGTIGQNWRGPYLEEDQDFPPVDHRGNPIIFNAPPQVFKDVYKKYEIYVEDPSIEDPRNFENTGY